MEGNEAWRLQPGAPACPGASRPLALASLFCISSVFFSGWLESVVVLSRPLTWNSLDLSLLTFQPSSHAGPSLSIPGGG